MSDYELWRRRHLKECWDSLKKLDSLLEKVPKYANSGLVRKTTNEHRIISSMKRDLKFAAQWLELGYEPPRGTDINRMNKRRREVLIDDFNRVHFENDDLTDVWEGEREEFRDYWADYIDQYTEE